ncbi:MAG: hypothetical protein ACE14W_06070 [Candidatus Velamenicoccus archaeovorus]
MRVRWLIVGIVSVGLLSPACRELAAEESTPEPPAQLEAIEGTDRVRVVLTPRAAERIDLQTAVAEPAQGGRFVVIPYASIFYGLNGETSTYTSPQPLTFVRELVTIDHVAGDAAFLSHGPDPGTAVVTVGAAELFGVESGIGS